MTEICDDGKRSYLGITSHRIHDDRWNRMPRTGRNVYLAAWGIFNAGTKGRRMIYWGFSHLYSFLSSILKFDLSGYLLTKYYPDPLLDGNRADWKVAAANVHCV